MHDFFHWLYKLSFISIEFITLSVIHGLSIALRIVDLGIESLQVLSIALEKVSKKELKFRQSWSDPMRALWLSMSMLRSLSVFDLEKLKC